MSNSVTTIIEANKCLGCQSCVSACPKGAISYGMNGYGFFTARIDEEKCVHCSICLGRCPAAQIPWANQEMVSARYGWSRDEKNRLLSTSGGVFTDLCLAFCQNPDDCVAGCVMKDNKVFHVLRPVKESDCFRGSKYVQSDLSDIFVQVKEKLETGHRVVFSGTPCQVYGLLQTIPNNLRDNLLTIDFVCHGVPSQKLFRDHCDYHHYQFLSFRDKTRKGWERSELKVLKKGKEKYIKQWRDKYVYMFNNPSCNNLNPACCECPFVNNHFSDFTLADFWKYSVFSPDEIDVKKGISLIVCNDAKADEIVSSMGLTKTFDIHDRHLLKERERRYDKNSSVRFYDYYFKHGYRKAMKKYAKNSYLSELAKKLLRK